MGLVIQIFILLTLLRMGRLISGSFPSWHKGIIFGLFCIGLSVNKYVALLATQENTSSFAIYWILYGLAALGLSCAFFYGVDKIPGIFNLPFQILGGILLVWML